LPSAGLRSCHYFDARPRSQRGHEIPVDALMQNGRSEMADRELIAAILTAGMLPILEIPRSRAHGTHRPVTETEGEDIQRAVGHPVGLYRCVLEVLRVDPFASLPGHDTPRQ